MQRKGIIPGPSEKLAELADWSISPLEAVILSLAGGRRRRSVILSGTRLAQVPTIPPRWWNTNHMPKVGRSAITFAVEQSVTPRTTDQVLAGFVAGCLLKSSK